MVRMQYSAPITWGSPDGFWSATFEGLFASSRLLGREEHPGAASSVIPAAITVQRNQAFLFLNISESSLGVFHRNGGKSGLFPGKKHANPASLIRPIRCPR